MPDEGVQGAACAEAVTADVDGSFLISVAVDEDEDFVAPQLTFLVFYLPL